ASPWPNWALATPAPPIWFPAGFLPPQAASAPARDTAAPPPSARRKRLREDGSLRSSSSALVFGASGMDGEKAIGPRMTAWGRTVCDLPAPVRAPLRLHQLLVAAGLAAVLACGAAEPAL